MSYKPFCTFSVPIDYLCLVNYIFFSIPQKNLYSFRSHHSPLNHRGFLILGEPTSTGKIGFYVVLHVPTSAQERPVFML